MEQGETTRPKPETTARYEGKVHRWKVHRWEVGGYIGEIHDPDRPQGESIVMCKHFDEAEDAERWVKLQLDWYLEWERALKVSVLP